MWVILGGSAIVLLAGLSVSIFLIPKGIWTLVTVLGSCLFFLIPCYYALKLKISVGAYKCKNCSYEIVPTYSEVIWGKHRETTRYLKCPKCNKVLGAKKVLKL